MTRAVVAIDLETALIRPAQLAPPLVCVTWQRPGVDARILHRLDAEPFLRSVLHGSDLIVGHNIAYDLAVVCETFPRLREAVFAAYEADRVTDTKIRQQLLDIAAGIYRGHIGPKGQWVKREYSLEYVAKKLAGMQLAKDGWRLSYAEFLTVPLARWLERAKEVQVAAAKRLGEGNLAEEDAKNLRALVGSDPGQCINYPLDDARATLAVYQAQEAHSSYLADQFRQARGAWFLHLSSAWGLRTDKQGVDRLRGETKAQLEEVEAGLQEAGLVKPDGVRDTKAAKARMITVCAAEKLPLRRTDAHEDCDKGDACTEHVCLDADVCNATGDDLLIDYAELSTLKKVLSTDVELLAKGTHWPVHPSYGLAETGRTTCRGPNIQNLRRKAGIREAFIPRPGHVFFQADYPQLELYTLAQCCISWLGFSKLGEALNAGLDAHLVLASTISGLTYDEAKRRYDAGDTDTDDIRQLAKMGNFGIPGGMGVPKLGASIKKQLTQTNPALLARLVAQGFLTEERLKWLKSKWIETWPEMTEYFARVNSLCDRDTGRASVETLFTKRRRGDASYCAACNNGFQALGSDCAKAAGFLIAKAQYVQATSPLFNTRTVAFVHDEFVGEALIERAHDAAYALADLMVQGANVYLPDVPIPRIKLKPLLMSPWSKKAKPMFGKDGRLVPWMA